jgi:predicted nicotinamide N-methyase
LSRWIINNNYQSCLKNAEVLDAAEAEDVDAETAAEAVAAAVVRADVTKTFGSP